jgi:hypothetical protein
LHSGVDDQDVEPAKRLDRDLHHLVDGGKLRHVGWHGKPLAPSRHNGLDGLVEIRLRTRRATDGCACLGIGPRDSFANASPGSGHNGNFPTEWLVGGLHTLPLIAYDNLTNSFHDKRRTIDSPVTWP